MKTRTIANISGYNGDEVDPCPICGAMESCDHSTSTDELACCEALAEQVASLTAQVQALAEAIVNLTNAAAPPSVVVRQVCSVTDGSPLLAYDIIPAGASSAADVVTFYRPYPAAEGKCACAPIPAFAGTGSNLPKGRD